MASPRILHLAQRSFFPRRGIAVALLAGTLGLGLAGAQAAQTGAPTGTDPQSSAAAAGQPTAAAQDAPAQSAPAQDNTPTAILSNTPDQKTKHRKGDEKVVKSKDTVKDEKARKKLKENPLANLKSDQPDKQLYDKAMIAMNKGKYDVARLDLQTLLSTYQDSEYMMRAKLAFADSWYKEGGTAALAQAESEYHDFIIFFPNAPEAAEAQMRIGDIYFKQMDKPDRDYSKAVHAEEEYRTMITQYPDSKLVPNAQQKLREVQEVLAAREFNVGSFYASHQSWAAAIARMQTVVDTYPLYSHMDEVLIGLGDCYAAEAKFVRESRQMNEDAKARLLKIYDDQAQAAYDRVVTQYAASQHVDDARDRLEAMGMPIPEPTPAQLAASQALENSRQAYTLANRAKGLLMRGPDVVQAARIGDPTLSDPKPTLAPEVMKRTQAEFAHAMDPKLPAPKDEGNAAATNATPAGDSNAPAKAPVTAAAPATLEDIPASDAPATSSGATPVGESAPTGGYTPTDANTAAPTGATAGVTILSPRAADATAAEPTGNGLKAVGPENTAPLPAAEAPAEAPDAVNDAAGQHTPAAQATPAKGKKAKADFDKDTESSSTHKKKKGIKKITNAIP